MALNKVLKVNSDAELLSFIINQDPTLSSEIDLPVQGESIAPIGRLIVSNERYKNAFLNAVNVIGLTVIDRNYWEDPWENFTNGRILNFGDSAREMAVDIADVFDYNEHANDPVHFLSNVVPNVLEYIHRINYQKFYKTTTSDEQIAMAFTTEGSLMRLIEEIISSLYEGYKYDKYIVNKYMLCRRILDGTMTVEYIANYGSLTPRQRVSKMKNVSNLMTFRSPDYNPAGLRIATMFENQICIINTDFEADLTTEVLSTSFFRNDAEMRSRMAMIDGYNRHDEARLIEVLGDQYIPFTEGELSELSNVIGNIIDDEWFQNYTYSLDNATDGSSEGLRRTSFFNPESLKNNHWLHYWGIKSTSPYKNGVVISKEAPSITSVTVSPATLTTYPGSTVQLQAVVATVGFANKAVTWSVTSAEGETDTNKVTVDLNGKVVIPADYDGTYDITITATSVYDTTKSNTSVITVASGE